MPRESFLVGEQPVRTAHGGGHLDHHTLAKNTHGVLGVIAGDTQEPGVGADTKAFEKMLTKTRGKAGNKLRIVDSGCGIRGKNVLASETEMPVPVRKPWLYAAGQRFGGFFQSRTPLTTCNSAE